MIFEYMDVEWILGGYCHQNLHQKNFPYYDKVRANTPDSAACFDKKIYPS